MLKLFRTAYFVHRFTWARSPFPETVGRAGKEVCYSQESPLAARRSSDRLRAGLWRTTSPARKQNRMTSALSDFACRVRARIQNAERGARSADGRKETAGGPGLLDEEFNPLALELFALQFAHNAPYRPVCKAGRVTPQAVTHWTQIPAVPTAAFKELALTCLSERERTTVFHSSGTTGQQPSRHFHNAESLAVYEASLWAGFAQAACDNLKSHSSGFKLLILTPPPLQAPHSSLVHMFETVRRKRVAPETSFLGRVATDGAWELDFQQTLAGLQSACADQTPLLVLGTAFSFVHLLDFLHEQDLRFVLPTGSRVMETGGYKGRSRSLPRAELHRLITNWLGIPPSQIVCEYGMSELSSQAYAPDMQNERRVFTFAPWARAQVISPETGREVGDGETGLIRVFDLANVCSVIAIQTEDLGVRRGGGFELVGRAAQAEPRGCSLMAATP